MERRPVSPRSNRNVHTGHAADGLQTTPLSASISHLQQAFRQLSSPGGGLSASSVDAGLMSRELVRSFTEQLRQGPLVPLGEVEHTGEGQVNTILRSLSHITQSSPRAVTATPSSDPTPSTQSQEQQQDDTPASAAERHRLGSSQTIDLQVSDLMWPVVQLSLINKRQLNQHSNSPYSCQPLQYNNSCW